LSEEIDPRELTPEVRAELRTLNRADAEVVGKRLVATGQLIDVEPAQALAHALVARRWGSRVPAVREAVGLAAYQAGQWQTAVSELRAYHRMTGLQAHVAVLADCERAMGRPERAIDLYRATDGSGLEDAERVELLIVAAGARMDMRQPEAAVAMLQIRELASAKITPWLARLRYAYADALLTAGREDEARDWFARAAEVDDDVTTDAAERLLELDGVVLEGDEEIDEPELLDGEEPAGEPAEKPAENPEESVAGPSDDTVEREAEAGEPSSEVGDTGTGTAETPQGVAAARPEETTAPSDPEAAGVADAPDSSGSIEK
jgi:tetratricopeptide (TPR) repeat protein